MRAVGYVRVSSARQRNGWSLGSQERAIRGYSERHGLRVVDVRRDEGASGSNGVEGRPGLAAALADLEAGRAEVFVVAKLDRLSRSILTFARLMERFQRGGWSFVAIEPGVDTGDAYGRLMLNVLMSFAEWEREMIRDRLEDGKAEKRANGGRADGRAPFGWRSEDGELVPVPEEQRVLRRVRRLHADGESLRAIADRLNADAVPTKTGRGRWHPTTVGRLVAR